MKKKFLIITSIMVLALSLGGFWGYNKYFKPDPEIQQELTNQFGEEFFNSFDEKNAVNTEKEENLNKIPIVGLEDKVKEQEEGEIGKPSTPMNENIVEKQLTQDEIYNKYKPKFSHLQNVAISRLDTLYSAAIQEYVQSKKTGTLNRAELAQKYLQAGTMLEANMDSQFYGTLDAMKADLIANNLPTDIVDVNKSEYEKAKSDKRSQLLAKVRK